MRVFVFPCVYISERPLIPPKGVIPIDIGANSYRRFLDGDDEAFVEIIRHYKDGLILYLNNFTHDLDTAEDLMEDTFVKIITKKPAYRPSACFKTWLFAIARNIARDWLRKQAKRQTLPIDEVVSELIAAEDLERQLLCTEEQLQLYRAFRRIRSDYAQVLYLIFFEGFHNSQAAVVMKKSTRQIENLLYRAKQALKSELEKDGFIYEGLL